MIKYILVNDQFSVVFDTTEENRYDGREGIINLIAKDHLVDLKCYRKIIKNKLGFERDAPIYLSKNMILIKMKSISNYYVNYCLIDYVKNDNDILIINFKDNSKLSIKYSYRRYLKCREKVNKIIEYLDNCENNYKWQHFHSFFIL